MLTPDQVPAVIQEACAAAQQACAQHIQANPDVWFPCGFAWVTINEKGSTKLGRALLKNGFDKAYGGGLQMWNPSKNPTQWMDAKEAGAYAAVQVFRKYGLDARVGSRMD